MARPAKSGGLSALCHKHKISVAQLFNALSPEMGERTLWDWVSTKPRSLEFLIMGVATEQQRLNSLWEITRVKDGYISYVPYYDLDQFLATHLGDWQIDADGVFDADNNKQFTLKNLGNKPVLII